jgi:hypothetical protein
MWMFTSRLSLANLWWSVTKNLELVTAHVRPRYRLPMNVPRVFRCFVMLLVSWVCFILNQATAIYNDNKVAADWSNSSSTKVMCHVNIWENSVREAIHEFNEITASHIPGQNNPVAIFTKEFKSDVIFRSYSLELIVVLSFSFASHKAGFCRSSTQSV